jgi:receptor protein-tyrosine kinase
MSLSRSAHLIERAVERMAELGTAPTAAAAASREPPPASSQAERTDGITAAAPEIGMAAMEAAGLAVAGARRSRIAEEWQVTAGRLMRNFRALRRDATGHAAGNLLLVTSCKPNEGKSFSAINLAGSVTLGRMTEVLLMDLDSKPGALTEVLGLSGRPGLFDLAADPRMAPETLLVGTAIAGLTVLPIGRAAGAGAGSADRSITRPVVAAIEAVARRFPQRLIILDSAPCLATSDASTLAGTVGQIAMIVEAERTQRDDVEAGLELLRPCANITLVLNKTRQSAAHAFGDYDYYNG